jgi:biotin carboxylase
VAERLCLVTAKPTDAVLHGFLPAAARLGLDTLVVTDRPEAYPGVLAVAGCDVRDFRALISCLADCRPGAVFTNSDHLQTQVAMAAAYFGLPGKDWRSCLRAKEKPLMRRRLAQTGTERVSCTELDPGPTPGDLPYPVVVKPADGVASEDVMLVTGPAELADWAARVRARRGPDARLIVEEYLPGTLRTLETIGDGRVTWVLGGFRTRLSPPPVFIEERLTWDPLPPGDDLARVRRALDSAGVSLGACHTEFVTTPDGPRLIEINDRLIGDHCDFLLADTLGVDVFELVLRVHLGESLPSRLPPAPRYHAVAEYIIAERPGLLASAPPAGPWAGGGYPGVRLQYWPVRHAGEQITLTGSNRDYLGTLTATGTDPDAVERAVAAARAGGGWEIRG